MIENARLTGRVVEQEMLRRDIALASDVQRRLLPDPPPRPIGGIRGRQLPARPSAATTAISSRYGRNNSGSRWPTFGKGRRRGLIMSVVQASLRIISSEGDISPPRLVARMNEFSTVDQANRYATFFYAQIDQRRRQLRYVNAGHNPPYLLRAGRASATDPASPWIEQLSVGGTVVGMFPEVDYEEATVRVCPAMSSSPLPTACRRRTTRKTKSSARNACSNCSAEIGHLPADGISARISAAMKNWIRDAEQYRRSHLHRDEGALMPQPAARACYLFVVVGGSDCRNFHSACISMSVIFFA